MKKQEARAEASAEDKPQGAEEAAEEMPWREGDPVQIRAELSDARKAQRLRAGWIKRMDLSVGQQGEVTAVMQHERLLRVSFDAGPCAGDVWTYVVENCVRVAG